MKKRILAFALTLAMVLTSLSVLSFVSFADNTQSRAAAADGDLYAWLYSLNVDKSVGKDDPLALANNNLLSNMIMCTAWDYEYVYLQIYYHSLSNTSTQYLDDISWTVGGATATVTNANLDSGASFGGTFGKSLSNQYVWEVSIPLNKINAKLTDGVLSADMTLNIRYDSDAKTINKSYNLIFSGRTLITRFWDINNNGTETNGYAGFDGSLLPHIPPRKEH